GRQDLPVLPHRRRPRDPLLAQLDNHLPRRELSECEISFLLRGTSALTAIPLALRKLFPHPLTEILLLEAVARQSRALRKGYCPRITGLASRLRWKHAPREEKVCALDGLRSRTFPKRRTSCNQQPLN